MRTNKIPRHRMVAHRLQRSKERQLNAVRNRYTQIDKFLCVFERAYTEYYLMPCNIRYAHGWYYLNGARYRHHQIERMLGIILAKIQELQCPNPDEETNDGQQAA
jgi:hypothetical protein